MLNARGGLTGRVKKEGNLIPPPKTRPKPRKPLTCYIPFLWSTCTGFFVGLFILLAGCAMSAVGFYAVQLSTTYNVTYSTVDEGTGVTTQSSVPLTHDNELYIHLKRLVIAGPVVMGLGLTVVVVACTVVFEEREKKLKTRPSEREAEEKKQKKGKYDLIVAKFKEDYNEASSHVNECFEDDEVFEQKIPDARRSSVYSMDAAMKIASSLLISPFHGVDSQGNIIKSASSLKSPQSDGSPTPEIKTENGWLKKSPLSDKRPNNRLMPLPALAPLYGDDNTSLRDTSWNSSQGSLSSTMNSVHNTPVKPKKEKTRSTGSSLASIKRETDDGKCLPKQNGVTNISITVNVSDTEAVPENDLSDSTMIVIQPNDSAKHLHPEVLILNETKASSDYDSSDQGSGIIETQWNSMTSTGHR